MVTSEINNNPLHEVDQLAQEIIGIRNKPLLVLYYPNEFGMILDLDVRDVHDEFRRRQWHHDRMKDEMDVLIHTYGGNPNASYRIGQVIRDFAKKVNFLVPFHSYSGGTLLCFSGNCIILGAYAVLGPIDITLGGIELASIDYYMEFAERCREDIEELINKIMRKRANAPSPILNAGPCSDVDCALLVEMVKQVGALNVGRFFRERTLTGHYGHRLLHDYMFAGEPNKESLSTKIANGVLFEFPSHDFDMDYHICKEIGLPVFEMTEEESDKTKTLVNKLDELSDQDVICRRITDRYKSPFFRLYDIEIEAEVNAEST